LASQKACNLLVLHVESVGEKDAATNVRLGDHRRDQLEDFLRSLSDQANVKHVFRSVDGDAAVEVDEFITHEGSDPRRGGYST
jgi:hypothetical protein